MIPSRFAHWNTSWKSLAFASILLFLVMALACEPSVTPNPDPPPFVEIPTNPEPPNPPGTGWLVWDSTKFRGTLTNFTILRNTISFNINGINPDGCVPQTTFTHAKNGNVFTVKAFYKPSDTLRICTQVTTPFTLQVFLPATSGTYRVFLRPTPISRAFDTTVTVP